jgi:hypothetical protein
LALFLLLTVLAAIKFRANSVPVEPDRTVSARVA